MNQNEILTVSQVNRIVKDTIESNPFLSHISVEGEISNFKRNASGHLYFTLKDESSQISCIMWRSSTMYLKFEPKNGDKVTVSGSIQLYQTGGTYQILVSRMSEAGIGILYQKYEELKRKLEAKGYFDSSHKKALPEYPKNIALLTSDTGAVIEDLKHVILNRSQFSNLILYPTKVQGSDAKDTIVRNIRLANENPIIDVIILARGGGSIEDLWPFNEEVVADAIFNSKKPIISAIGHETDFTISDFVADVRAATPSNAGEIVVKDSRVLRNNLDSLTLRLKQSYYNSIQTLRTKLTNLVSIRIYKDSTYLLSNKYQNLLGLTEKLELLSPKEVIIKNIERNNTNSKHLYNAYKSYVVDKVNNYQILNEKLYLLNPLSILSKGYSITFKDDVIVKDAGVLNDGDIIKTKFKDSEVLSKVIKE